MIQFLKESTFAVNDVIRKSWLVLKSNYFSIAGLCLSLFITSNASGVLAFYLQDVSPALSYFMAFLFVVAYFGIQLTLFKYIFRLIDRQEKIRLSRTIPTTREMARFFMAMLIAILLILASYLIVSVLAWPLIYLFGVGLVVNATIVVAAFFTLYLLLRIAFYPFFIIDRNSRAIEAIRLSLALTKGNVVKLLLILAFFAILHLLYIYFNYLGYPLVSTFVSVLTSFIVVPLSSVIVAMAYRVMMKRYG
ncbi:MAG TPA: hypothetical protein VKZ78_06590 [Sphingobacteriaceae bacterium]|nr:hypothetical protein [Sphingobacteriaceae bacterium]